MIIQRGQIVISGHKTAIARAIKLGKEYGAKKVIPLAVSGAFHSELVREAADKVSNGLADMIIKQPLIPIIANVTAKPVDSAAQIQDLLTKQVTGKVRWRETIIELKKLGITDIVEIGSAKILSGLTKRIESEINVSNIEEPQDLENFLQIYNI